MHDEEAQEHEWHESNFRRSGFAFDCTTKAAGLLTIDIGTPFDIRDVADRQYTGWWISFHFFPKKGHRREFGFKKAWHAGPIYQIGLGSLLLICWNERWF